MRNKGFTLVELMVVVLIVGILAAVAIPMMRGRIDAAKWSEGKAGAGTIASSIRAYVAEKGEAAEGTPDIEDDLGFGLADLSGTYFNQSCYTISTPIDVDDTTGAASFAITVAVAGGTSEAPTTPPSKILTVTDNVAAWSDGAATP